MTPAALRETLCRLGAVGVFVVTAGLGSADAPSYDESWHMCVSAEQCVWVQGGGDWPDAVHKDHVKSYSGWIAATAPYTTYFMPGDCFASRREVDDFIAESRDHVACLAGRCRIDLKPTCTK